ncbi:MAG: hypothetical protein EOO75_04200 [Myxococcales bacterium]|nr:MAG: hypothetical protein EOO75_04200 [Myxococcales bacterium]
MNLSTSLLALALLTSTLPACGVCGSEKLVEKARSQRVIASNEMGKGQRETLQQLKLVGESEAVIWYYDRTVTGSGSEGNLLTTKRIVSYRNRDVFEAAFPDIRSASHESGGTSERIRVEKSSGEFVVLQFGLGADSKRMYESLCQKIEGKCKK